MAREFPLAIEELARKHQLGTPVQIFPRLGLLLFFWCSVSMLAIFDIVYGLHFFVTLFTNQRQIDPVGFLVPELIGLGLIALGSYGIRHVRPPPHYCLCTEGFLELNRSDPPNVIHALRWGDVTSTRRVSLGRGQLYYVRTRHGKEIRITNRDIWDSCTEHVHKRKGKSS